MSRRDGRRVVVTCDAGGVPQSLALPGAYHALPVLARMEHWREWLGALDGEPERDVWRVETQQGVCELHRLRPPSEEETGEGEWLLHAWED